MSRAYASPSSTSAPSASTSAVGTTSPALSSANASPTSAAALQGSAGNTAVQEQLRGSGNLGTPVAQSANPEVAGRTPEDLAADLKRRIADYWAVVPDLQEIGESQVEAERSWLARRGVFGLVIDALTPGKAPEAGRWEGVLARWEGVDQQLEAAMSTSADALSTLGSLAAAGISAFDAAAQAQAEATAGFQSYLGNFTQSAHTLGTVADVGRDISFAAAVGVAVVAAAPVVAGAASATATAAGASSGTAAACGTTAAVLSAADIGMGIEGGGRAVAAAASEGIDVLEGGEFEGDKVIDEAVAGANRGVIDGVLGLLGAGIEKAIAPAVSKLTGGLLGASGSKLASTTVSGGLSGGVSGGLTGALDGGVSAGLEGGDLGDVGDAMQRGLIVGALSGALLGGAGSALGSLWTPQTADELLRLDPEAFAARYAEILAAMTPEERARFDRHLQGRRFVDRKDYLESEAAHASGASEMPPEHRYGADKFADWSEAAAYTDGLAAEGLPMTRADLEQAHALAARNLNPEKVEPGKVRTPSIESSGRAVRGEHLRAGSHVLSPEQLAAVKANPHIGLLSTGNEASLLTPEQAAAGFGAGEVTYPLHSEVQSRLDEFFAWYGETRGTLDPVAFAAQAQQQLVSIHPFGDGNGRVTRLVMDHALQSEGLPPSLLADTSLDLFSTPQRWAEEVRAGVLETYTLAASHAAAFNDAMARGDRLIAAARWGALLGLTGGATQNETLHDQGETSHAK